MNACDLIPMDLACLGSTENIASINSLFFFKTLKYTMKPFVSLLVYVYLIQAYPAQLYRSPLFGGSDMGPNFDDQAYSMAPKVIGFTRLLIRSGANGIKGIQATYEQEDGEIKPQHTMVDLEKLITALV